MARQITITLDEDVAARIEREAERSRRPVDEVANEMLRTARAPEEPAIESKPFVVRPFNMGKPLIDLDCTARALAELDRLEQQE